MRWIVLLGFVPGVLTAQAPAVPDILREFDRLADHLVWPGFNARHVPVAIFDGRDTWLTRHPSPPAAFTPVPDRAGEWRMAGRHEALRANTSTEIGGVRTATLIVEPSRNVPAARYGAVLIHETFHVFQQSRYPSWGGNEVELFTYPMDDSTGLALRKLETEALRHALAADDPESAACWSRRVLALRNARFERLPAGAVEYERGTELLEGLADYVEFRAAGGDAENILTQRDFAADAVRERSYAVGTALAVLLDRFAPRWTSQLDRERGVSLDELLDAAVTARATGTCTLPEMDRKATRAWAREMIADLRARRSVVRNRVFSQEGWTVEFVSPDGEPFFPRNFDPWNVHVVDSTEVVHTRWIEIGNSAGSLEVLDRDVLTVGVGPHPLFNGVRRVIVAGLETEPTVEPGEDGIVVIRGTGLTARFREANVTRGVNRLVVSLP